MSSIWRKVAFIAFSRLAAAFLEPSFCEFALGCGGGSTFAESAPPDAVGLHLEKEPHASILFWRLMIREFRKLEGFWTVWL